MAASRYGGNRCQNSSIPNNPYTIDRRAQHNHPPPRPSYPHVSQYNNQAAPSALSSIATPSSVSSMSPSTPGYQIPRPPIPGQISELNIVFTSTGSAKEPQPVGPPPPDPRALLHLPQSLHSPPQPVIPLKPATKSFLDHPVSNLPDAASLFCNADALLPDPSASATDLDKSNSMSNINRCIKSKPLLLTPDSPKSTSLLPTPFLLPDPFAGPTPSQLEETRRKHEAMRDLLDEDDWKIISDPSEPVQKIKSDSMMNDCREESEERSVQQDQSQKMAADSTIPGGEYS